MAKKQNRPTSPHLTIYKPQITSVLSIMHRGTGVFLTLGALALSAWIALLVDGGELYKCFQEMLAAWYGKILLIGWAFSLFYHLCNGIRHLFWDIGVGFDIKVARATGWLTIFSAIALTYLAWAEAMRRLGE